MRIGISTIFDNENHGNRLQNYALQAILEHYTSNVITLKNKPRFSSGISNLLRGVALSETVWINRLVGKKRKVCFLQFNNRCVHITPKCYWMNDRNIRLRKKDVCDLYCTGSDQVWNPGSGRGRGFDYLSYAEYEQTFSYAASFGVEEIPEKHRDAVRKGLNHIKFISVREDAGKRIVEELTGRTDAQVLVDPTMLLTTEEWDEVARKPKGNVPEKYVLTYFLGAVSEERRAAIVRKAREMGCQLIELMDKNGPFYAIGPDHFVYLIKHAALVCTDSFHGSVFSFLYQRPLAIFDRKGSADNMSSRLETLCSKFGLEHCMARGDEMPELPMTPDYSEGFAVLDAERKRSKDYLKMVFEEAERLGLCK